MFYKLLDQAFMGVTLSVTFKPWIREDLRQKKQHPKCPFLLVLVLQSAD